MVPPERGRWQRRAMFQLAWCYEKGLGVDRDTAQAADWYRRGAELGSSACMNNLAELLAKGDGVPRDLEQAMDWYRRAAEQDDECAWYNLGWYHEQAGETVQALDCLRRADELGDGSACWGLGRFYETGTAVEQDLEQAFEYYQKGAELEDLNSLCRLVRCYALGIGTQKDREKVPHWPGRSSPGTGRRPASWRTTAPGRSWRPCGRCGRSWRPASRDASGPLKKQNKGPAAAGPFCILIAVRGAGLSPAPAPT